MARQSGTTSKAAQAAKDNPAVERLREQATGYALALGRNLNTKIETATEKLQEQAEGGRPRDPGDPEPRGRVQEKARGAMAGLATALGSARATVQERLPGRDGGQEPGRELGRGRRHPRR